MSTTNYDFRKVLDAQPARGTCVGTTKAGRDGPRRCSNPLTVTNCAQAESILDVMNRGQAASLQNIEDLALVMLCKEHNNEETRPDLCQVDELCVKWEAKIEEYERSLKLEGARKAVMNSMRELNSMQKTVENITGKQVQKRKSSMTIRLRTPERQDLAETTFGTTVSAKLEVPIKTEPKVEDPFTSRRSSHRSSITSKGNYSIFPPTYLKETPVREQPLNPSPNITKRPSNTETAAETDTENQRETWCLPIQHPGPLPPSKNAPRSGRSRAATTPSTRTPKRAATSKATPAIKPRVPSQTFNFQLSPTKVKNEPNSDDFNCSASIKGQLPSFNHSFIAQLPEPRHSVSSVIEDSPTLARTTSGFGFGNSAYKVPPKVFQFEKKPEPTFTINLPERLADLAPSPVKKSFSVNTRKELPDKPNSAYLHITTPPQTPPQNISPCPSESSLIAQTPHRLPSTPDFLPSATFPRTPSPCLQPQTQTTITRVPSNNRLSTLLNTLPPLPTKTPYNDDFGYATVTPTATRYKTFKLPKGSGLATPPETPDPLPRLGLYTGPFQPTKFPGFNVGAEPGGQSPDRKSAERRSIQRKPVPVRRSADDECDHIWAMKPIGQPSATTVRKLLGSPVMRRPTTENPNWPIRVEGASLAPRRRTGPSISEEERMELNCVPGVGLPRLRKRMLRQMLGMKNRVDGKPKHGLPAFI